MKQWKRQLWLMPIVIASACGAEASLATNPRDEERTAVEDFPVKTNALAYRLDQSSGGGIVTIQARYRNDTGVNLYYPPCGAAHVRRTGADSTRKLFTVFGACISLPAQPLVLPPGETLTLNVMFGTPAQVLMTPPLQREWLSGTMRVSFFLCARDNNGTCVPLPQRLSQSNAFEVHY